MWNVLVASRFNSSVGYHIYTAPQNDHATFRGQGFFICLSWERFVSDEGQCYSATQKDPEKNITDRWPCTHLYVFMHTHTHKLCIQHNHHRQSHSYLGLSGLLWSHPSPAERSQISKASKGTFLSLRFVFLKNLVLRNLWYLFVLTVANVFIIVTLYTERQLSKVGWKTLLVCKKKNQSTLDLSAISQYSCKFEWVTDSSKYLLWY